MSSISSSSNTPEALEHSVPAGVETAVHVAALAARNGWQPRRFGMSVQGVPLLAWWPTMERPTRIVYAAIHGEESVTALVAHQLLRTVHANDACSVVVPVLNPDGMLLGTRQNARGVDLNRNFPGPTWCAEASPTFWPTSTVRTAARRTQLSSPGAQPGSEPETQAMMALVEQVRPRYVIDLHTPLECVLALTEGGVELGTHLAEPTGVPVITDLGSPTNGDSGAWCTSVGVTMVTYEFEAEAMPKVWARHHEAMVRAIVERLSV